MYSSLSPQVLINYDLRDVLQCSCRREEKITNLTSASCGIVKVYQGMTKQGRKSVFNIGGYYLELMAIFRSLETLEGMIDNFQAKKLLFTLEK